MAAAHNAEVSIVAVVGFVGRVHSSSLHLAALRHKVRLFQLTFGDFSWYFFSNNSLIGGSVLSDHTSISLFWELEDIHGSQYFEGESITIT